MVFGAFTTYGMDYAQDQWDSQEEIEQWLLEQCRRFTRRWRENVEEEYGSQKRKWRLS